MRLKLLDARIIFGEVFWYYFQILSNQTRNLRLSHPMTYHVNAHENSSLNLDLEFP